MLPESCCIGNAHGTGEGCFKWQSASEVLTHQYMLCSVNVSDFSLWESDTGIGTANNIMLAHVPIYSSSVSQAS